MSKQRGKHQYSNRNSNCIPNLNILFLKEDERFHKSEEKKTQNPKWEQNVVSRAFTSSGLAVFLSLRPRPLCKQAFREHSFGNGLENKQFKTSAEKEQLGQGQCGNWLKQPDAYS